MIHILTQHAVPINNNRPTGSDVFKHLETALHLYTKYLVWYMSNISIHDDVNQCQQIDRSHLSVKTKLVTNPNLLVYKK